LCGVVAGAVPRPGAVRRGRLDRHIFQVLCQDFEFPVLVVLLYVHEATVCHIVELDLTTSDSPTAMLLPSLRAWFQCGTPYFDILSMQPALKSADFSHWILDVRMPDLVNTNSSK
jgi:hypothetical protein